VGDQLFFVADDGVHGEVLWRSDGTATGTRRMSDNSSGEMVGYRGELLFRGFDSAHGWELWRSDGTTAGTKMVKDIVPGKGRPYFAWLMGVGDTLFFSADYPEHGSEPWSSDGTASGTRLVRDIYPGRQRYGGTLRVPASSVAPSTSGPTIPATAPSFGRRFPDSLPSGDLVAVCATFSPTGGLRRR
jgi:ELWxxDGT repeat protein